MRTPRWVFFDVGNVLLDEDPLTFLVFQRHAEAVRRVRDDWTAFDVLAAREAKALAGSRWPLFEAVVPVLGESGCAEVWASADKEVRARYAELSPLIPGAAEAVERLGGRFLLGVIANQGAECRARLDGLGLLERFGVVALSEELGLFKPDPALFLAALDRAGASPGACLMVGDRPDNDLAPASALGMATAWVRWPRREAKGWDPGDPLARAYQLSLQRVAERAPAPDPPPGVTVDAVGDLDGALRYGDTGPLS